MDFDEIRRRLSRLDTACVCDGYKALDKPVRAVDPAVRPITPGLKLIGRAHTVTCHEDFLTVIAALRDASPGEVLVIDSQGSTKALTGELFPTEAKRKGLAGIVNDGPCRDTAAIRRLGVPYFARSVTPVAGATDRLFESQVPVTCGGVRVHPGEIVFGDDDGLIVAADEEIAEVIPIAEEVQRKEARLLAEMKNGVSLIEMLNLEDHCARIRAGEESKLRFLA